MSDATGHPYQYIVLHESLRDHPGAIAVHAAHAAGEACFDGPAPSNTRCIVLSAPDSESLAAAGARLAAETTARYVLIVEDEGVRSGQVTALGTEPVSGERREAVRAILRRFGMFR